LEQEPGQRPDSHSHGGLASTGSLQNLADPRLIVDGAGQVYVSSPRCGGLGQALELCVFIHPPPGHWAPRRHAAIDTGVATRPARSFCRSPPPYPPCRRSSSQSISEVSTVTPEGNPSTIAVSAWPCDSPEVR